MGMAFIGWWMITDNNFSILKWLLAWKIAGQEYIENEHFYNNFLQL